MFRRRAAMARPLWPAEGLASSVLDRAWQMHPILGPGQAAVLSELEAAGGEGTAPGAIARALNYDPPDMHTMLGVLTSQGLVDEDRSVYPQVYRLSPALLGGAAGGASPMTDSDGTEALLGTLLSGTGACSGRFRTARRRHPRVQPCSRERPACGRGGRLGPSGRRPGGP